MRLSSLSALAVGLLLSAATPARAQWVEVQRPTQQVGAEVRDRIASTQIGALGPVVIGSFASYGNEPCRAECLFTSSDHGQTWSGETFYAEALETQLPTAHALDRSLASGALRIARSADGLAWTLLPASNLPTDVPYARLVETSDGTLWASTGEAFARSFSSTDGVTWTAVPAPAAPTAGYRVWDASGATVFASVGPGGQRVVVRSPGDPDWRPSGLGSTFGVYSLDARGATVLVNAPSVVGGVVRFLHVSTDGGATWRAVDFGDAYPDDQVTGAVAWIGSGGQLFAQIDTRDLLVSLDAGLTWTSSGPSPGEDGNEVGFSDDTYAYLRTSGFDGRLWRRPLSDFETPVAARGGPSVARLTLSVAPNPSAGPAALRLSLADASAVRATVVDALGRHVATVHDGPLAVGPHTLALPAGLAPGVYAARLVTPGGSASTLFSVTR